MIYESLVVTEGRERITTSSRVAENLEGYNIMKDMSFLTVLDLSVFHVGIDSGVYEEGAVPS